MNLPDLQLPFLVSTIPSWVNWLAQDEDGSWWGYSVEPLQQVHGWYENEVGQYTRLGQGPAQPDWREQLYNIRQT